MSLEQTYAEDKELLDFYKNNLIIPGWAGEVNDDEAEYISKMFIADRSIKRSWRKALRQSSYPKRFRSKPSIAVMKDWVEHLTIHYTAPELK